MKKFFTLATLLFLVIIVGCHKPESELFSPKNDLVVMGSTLNEPPYPPSFPYADVTIRRHGCPCIIDTVWLKAEIYNDQGHSPIISILPETIPYRRNPDGSPVYRFELSGDRGYITTWVDYHTTEHGQFSANPPLRTYYTWGVFAPVNITIQFLK